MIVIVLVFQSEFVHGSVGRILKISTILEKLMCTSVRVHPSAAIRRVHLLATQNDYKDELPCSGPLIRAL